MIRYTKTGVPCEFLPPIIGAISDETESIISKHNLEPPSFT